MLIRRVIGSIRSQNWFIVWAEFVLVIFGVFIGIQVSNWNDGRIDRGRAHSYLERIRSDLESDIETYRDRVSFWAAVSGYGGAGLDYAESRARGDLSSWDFLPA